MKIGIYDPYLDTLAGGEKYMLTVAECLSKENEVFILWDHDRDAIKRKIVNKFDMHLSNIQFSKNIFAENVSFWERFRQSRLYDRLFVLSDGSIPLVNTKLFLHFQTPMEWVHVDIKTKIKLRRIEKIICNSLYTKKYIDKKFHVKSEVVYPPVSINTAKTEEKENIILNVGRYGIQQAGSSYKKQEILVSAFKKLVDSGIKNWQFILVVSIFDKDKDRLEGLNESIKRYPIQIVVNPENSTLWNIYKKSKIYWHAAGYGEDLEKHPDRAEHFGIATVEAMGVGAVPIVINAGGQKEIVHDNQNGFLWANENELIEKTKEVITNAKLLQKLSQNAKQRAEEFDSGVFCRKITKVIE